MSPSRFGEKVLDHTEGGACVQVNTSSWDEEPEYETTTLYGVYKRYEEWKYETVAWYSDGHGEVISFRWEPGRAYESRSIIEHQGQPCIP